MKRIIVILISLLCACTMIYASGCNLNQSIGIISAKLVESRYKIDVAKISSLSLSDDTIKYEGKVIKIETNKQLSNSTRKILVLEFELESDFNLAIDEKGVIAKDYFGEYCIFRKKKNTIIMANSKDALKEFDEVSYDNDLANVFDNLIESGYTISGDKEKIESYKLVTFILETKRKTVSIYFFEKKEELQDYYEDYADFYQEEIKEGQLSLAKKGKLLIVANGESAKKDALGK